MRGLYDDDDFSDSPLRKTEEVPVTEEQEQEHDHAE
jgi:hypothetical protein